VYVSLGLIEALRLDDIPDVFQSMWNFGPVTALARIITCPFFSMRDVRIVQHWSGRLFPSLWRIDQNAGKNIAKRGTRHPSSFTQKSNLINLYFGCVQETEAHPVMVFFSTASFLTLIDLILSRNSRTSSEFCEKRNGWDSQRFFGHHPPCP